MNQPSIFVCKHHRESDGFEEEFAIDLSTIALMSRRPGGSYYINFGTSSIALSQGIGDQVWPAWLSFKGKFAPGQTN